MGQFCCCWLLFSWMLAYDWCSWKGTEGCKPHVEGEADLFLIATWTSSWTKWCPCTSQLALTTTIPVISLPLLTFLKHPSVPSAVIAATQQTGDYTHFMSASGLWYGNSSCHSLLVLHCKQQIMLPIISVMACQALLTMIFCLRTN